MATGMLAHAIALKGQLVGPLTLATLSRPSVLLGVYTCALLPQGGVLIARLCQARPNRLL
jgi:hypothetical protein